jgi:hypothetical protein
MGFLIGLLFTAFGAVMALDVRGLGAKIWEENTGFSPWGRKLRTSGWDYVGRMILGWGFLAFGGLTLAVTIIGGGCAAHKELASRPVGCATSAPERPENLLSRGSRDRNHELAKVYDLSVILQAK